MFQNNSQLKDNFILHDHNKTKEDHYHYTFKEKKIKTEGSAMFVILKKKSNCNILNIH